MSSASKAVFLSYASQDAEAAKRICEALRAAGVEVWFDQNELVGGDAWDAKIRKQIKECALFLPIISANTQARTEGYFRLEWRLADQRTHLMAKGRPFLLPVVIDETRDADTHVPDSFTDVQWTRLPADETPAAFAEQVKQLLGGEMGPRPPSAASESKRTRASAVTGKPVRWIAPAFIAIAVIAVFAFWQPWRTQGPSVPAAATATPTTAFPRVPELRRAWQLALIEVNSTAEDFALAEEIVKAALARRPTDPETVIVYAWLNDYFLNRGFDLSEERHVLARRYAERAVQLAPDEPEALAALGLFLSFRRADLPRAEQLMRRAIELKPREPRFHRALAYNILRFHRPEEWLPAAERAAELFPKNALVLYELGMAYRDAGRIDDMERAFDRTLALASNAGAALWKAWIAGWVHGDLAGMKRMIEQVPDNSRLSDRALIVRYQAARLTHDPDELANALRALQAFPGVTLRDFWFTGPKALLIGDLFAAQGKPELAKAQFEMALTELARDKAAAPVNVNVLTAECWTLLGLGRRAEAKATLRLVLGLRSADVRIGPLGWWFNILPAALLLGERDVALQQLGLLNDRGATRHQLRVALRIDPRMAPFRDDAEIVALIADPKSEPAAIPGAKPADDKSVAVLAFANLSDDKSNEYFSDGISEELLNVLAKVPGLKVSARTSAFYFKGKQVPVAEIARQLGVAYVVEGSVRKAGSQVRITAQLVKAADSFQVWSDTFTRELKDIFALQDEIAGLIAQNLRLKLDASGPAKKAVQPEAYALLLEGRYFLARRSEADFVEAEKRFRQALEIDADFAPAFAGIADAAVLRGTYELMEGGSVQPADFARARAAARRAMELDPTLAEPHHTLGLLYVSERKFADADREFAEGFRLNPNYGIAYHWRALLTAALGRFDEAIADLERAISLDPLATTALFTYARFIFAAGRTQEALAPMERAIALRPSFYPAAHGARALFLLKLGRREEALAEARLVRKNLAAPTRWWADGDALYVLKQAGAPGEAEAYLRELRSRFPAESHLLGYGLLAVGESQEAWRLLAGTNPISWTQLYWAPMMEPHHHTPALRDLFTRLAALEHYDRARATIVRLRQEHEAKK